MVNAKVIIAVVIIISLIIIAAISFLIWKNRGTICSWVLCRCCFLKESQRTSESLESVQVPVSIVHPNSPPSFNPGQNCNQSYPIYPSYPSAPPPYTTYPESYNQSNY